jgi:hypothetical protein
MVSFEVQTAKFVEAINMVYEHSRKTIPEILNRGMLVAIIGGSGVQGAMQLTPKAAKDAILSTPIKLIAGYVVNKHKGEKMTRQQMYDYIRKEVRRRISAIGYTATVGWNNAAIAFGGRGIRSNRTTGRGFAELGSGTPSNEGMWPNFEAAAVNTAPAASVIGEQPMQEALDNAAEDMIRDAEERMQSIFNAT